MGIFKMYAFRLIKKFFSLKSLMYSIYYPLGILNE